MNCELGSIPLKYLGTPISNKALTIPELEPMVKKVAKRVEPWQGKLLASGGRLVLMNNYLTNIQIFIMGFYLLQEGIHEKMDRVRSRFFWAIDQGKQKYHMACYF